jgi:dihydroxyacetone kinase-like protein
MTELNLAQARLWIDTAARSMTENASMLTQMDIAIGDGDHGTNMSRGFTAVEMKLQGASTPDISALFKLVGMTLLSTVGGAAGPLYGGFFLELGKSAAGKAQLSKADLQLILANGLTDIKRRGKAELGDKTIVDALTPAVMALQSAPDGDLSSALKQAAEAAKEGVDKTVPLQARKGRASYLGERSIGYQDPGATSCWLLLKALAEVPAS